jgi:hypothetical protein
MQIAEQDGLLRKQLVAAFAKELRLVALVTVVGARSLVPGEAILLVQLAPGGVVRSGIRYLRQDRLRRVAVHRWQMVARARVARSDARAARWASARRPPSAPQID